MEEISQVSKWFKYSLKASKQLLWYFLLAGQFSNDHWNIQSTWLLKVHIRDIKKKPVDWMKPEWMNTTGNHVSDGGRNSESKAGPESGLRRRRLGSRGGACVVAESVAGSRVPPGRQSDCGRTIASWRPSAPLIYRIAAPIGVATDRILCKIFWVNLFYFLIFLIFDGVAVVRSCVNFCGIFWVFFWMGFWRNFWKLLWWG